MEKYIIIGHKNPDTDSIVSAIVAQDYFKEVLDKDAKAYRAGELNNESRFVLDKYDIKAPELVSEANKNDRIALVDHNETTQTFDKLNFSQVEYIFDHHKLSLSTEKPIYLRNEPLGSTSSLLAKMFKENRRDVSEKNAKLLLAGILSDTLNFTSPTTTDEDKRIVSELNDIAKVDIKRFVGEMFEAKSSLEGISTSDIINLDYKIFNIGKYKVGVGTWETTSPATVNVKKNEIFNLLKKKKETEHLDYLYFMIVDILRQNCDLYIISEDEKMLAEKVFGGKTENGVMFLDGVVSRKKQIAPPLTEALTK
ncbi:MAG: manganese-dependent inorganic pyrophosphatase [Candidatus Moranbacteria bacterium]|nr:manganese-dependent inorganic pyrophosphatase [Candidatus Moranbacteria bacterium]